LEIKFKLGLEAVVSGVKIGGGLFKNPTTGETGGELTADVGIIGGQIERRGMGSGDAPEFKGSLLGFEKNFTTGEKAKFSPAKEFLRFGAVLGAGFEITFNPDTFNAISAANDKCRAAGGR